MLHLDLPINEKEAIAINRRRILEEQRKCRIFNARQRLIGVDEAALEQQVKEKNFREKLEKDRDNDISSQMLKFDQMAVMLEQHKQDEIRTLNKEIDEFRRRQQRPETRREFDIHDPDLLKKSVPARVCDDDPNCSVSGAQILDGEDLSYADRQKKQKKQLSDWLQLQMLENRAKQEKNQAEKNKYDSKLLQLDNHAVSLQKAEEETRRRVATGVKDYNACLAEEQKQVKNERKKEETISNLQEIYNNFYGDMLTENPRVARSVYGPHRVIPDRWKGMDEKQLKEYYDGQRNQMTENKHKKELEAQDMARWDFLRLNQDRHAVLLQRDEYRQRRQLDKNDASRNYCLSQEQRAQQNYINNILYTNIPTDEYYAQFNTTTR